MGRNLQHDAQTVYRHLVSAVLPTGTVTTYGDVERATGVPIGPHGEWIGRVLGEIFRACDRAAYPPLPAIVVRQEDAYAAQHGMPGPGYFVAEGNSPNKAGRRRDPGWDWWVQENPPAGFHREDSRWALRAMIEAHQDSVWARHSWPSDLNQL